MTTSTLNVPEGSFASCRAPPPQPAKRAADAIATALVAHHALQDLSTARGPYQRQVSCRAGGILSRRRLVGSRLARVREVP